MLRALVPWVAVLSLAGCDDRSDPADASVTRDAATEDASALADAGGLPLCPSPSPMEGSPCSPDEACQIPGSPCSFVYRCVDRMWEPETICPSPDAGP